jgi:hypothetical protein
VPSWAHIVVRQLLNVAAFSFPGILRSIQNYQMHVLYSLPEYCMRSDKKNCLYLFTVNKMKYGTQYRQVLYLCSEVIYTIEKLKYILLVQCLNNC